jgi:hypothetical protein
MIRTQDGRDWWRGACREIRNEYVAMVQEHDEPTPEQIQAVADMIDDAAKREDYENDI